MKVLPAFTSIPCCYVNTVTDMFLRIIHVSILPSYCGNSHTLKATLNFQGQFPNENYFQFRFSF